MQLRSLLLAVTAALCATTAHAIRVNDHAFVANGGDLANIDGTATNVFDALRTASTFSSFRNIGRLGDCTATYIGSEGDHLWLLTAASCVPNTNLMQAVDGLLFTDYRGRVVAGGPGGMSFIHPKRIHRPEGVQDAGTDIAMVRLKRVLPDHQFELAHGPALLNDDLAELGAAVDFVSHGAARYGQNGPGGRSLGAVWPGIGVRRAWGTSVVDHVVQDGHALIAGYAMGSATRWAGLDATDAGAAWLQRAPSPFSRHMVVATGAGGAATDSTGARVSMYASWIKGLFPGVVLASDAWRGPAVLRPIINNAFRSAEFDAQVAFVVAPGQPRVLGPRSHFAGWGGGPHTVLRVPVTEARTGRVSEVDLAAVRTSCYSPMNDSARCGSKATLQISYTSNNPLPRGQWQGSVAIDAVHPSEGSKGRIDVPINFWTNGYRLQRHRAIQQIYYAPTSGSAGIYFTVPVQAGASGPVVGNVRVTPGESVITVQAVDAVTQTTVPIKLRAYRSNGCYVDPNSTSNRAMIRYAMNNAVLCPGGGTLNWMTVKYEDIDNATLQPGRYQASFTLLGRNWFDADFRVDLPIDLDINLLP